MTRRTDARIAGLTFLVYIAAGVASLMLFGRAAGGDGVAAKLATMAQHVTDLRIVVLLALVQCVSALVLAATLYALTREVDETLAVLALICRAGEGVLAGLSTTATLALLWLATGAGADMPAPAIANALAAYLLRDDVALTGTFFALGSALFAYLMLRGRMIPTLLAWLGVVASVLLVVGLPLQLAGFLHGTVTSLLWLPMALFEIPLAFLLLFRGVDRPGGPPVG